MLLRTLISDNTMQERKETVQKLCSTVGVCEFKTKITCRHIATKTLLFIEVLVFRYTDQMAATVLAVSFSVQIDVLW